MWGVLDIHSHILPGVDDGARDLEQTKLMLGIAYEEGICGMVATPHYGMGRNNCNSSDLQKRMEQVMEVAPEGFQLYLGNEVLYGVGIIEALDCGAALTIAGTRYVLVEYMPEVSYSELTKSIRAFQLAGYIPIIAHAERYYCLRQKMDYVGELIQVGAYIQINYSSIGGSLLHPEESFCRKLLDNNWVHFLGTDTHGPVYRGPCVRKTLTYLKKRYGDEVIQSLVWDNPQRMLEDKHL